MKRSQGLPDKKRRLIGAAIQMILVHGYSGTTVDLICAEAEVTKGSFFHYFASKEDIACAAMDAWSAGWQQILNGANFDSIDDPVDRLYRLIDVMSDTYMDPTGRIGCVVGMIAQELSHSNERMREICARHFDMWLEPTVRLLSDAKAARQAEFDPESVALFMITLVQGSMLVAKTRADRPMIAANLDHLRAYLNTLFQASTNPQSKGNQ